jgi:hypothetical protein
VHGSINACNILYSIVSFFCNFATLNNYLHAHCITSINYVTWMYNKLPQYVIWIACTWYLFLNRWVIQYMCTRLLGLTNHIINLRFRYLAALNLVIQFQPMYTNSSGAESGVALTCMMTWYMRYA